MKRYIQDFVQNDLSKKMVFIGGPRQVGKTTLANMLLDSQSQGQYFNWDNQKDRRIIRDEGWLEEASLVVFDELHKLPKWKTWIKGIYDTKPKKQQYLVTGSARLDVYRRGGDSLLGRYHYWRMHPLTIDELPSGFSKREGIQRLLTLGGFPEPFLLGDEREAKRWRRERFDRIFREDIRDLYVIRDIQLLQLFTDALRSRVGNQVILSNIAQDLEISPTTAKEWLRLIENMYVAFAVYPYTVKIHRAIQKPPKVFFYDNGDTESDLGGRFENLVATTLLKRLHFIEDYEGSRCQLFYIRDKDGREVDFATVVDKKLHELIEVKTSEEGISTSLRYYRDKLKPVRAVQIVLNLKKSYEKDGILVTNSEDYFSNPPWIDLVR